MYILHTTTPVYVYALFFAAWQFNFAKKHSKKMSKLDR